MKDQENTDKKRKKEKINEKISYELNEKWQKKKKITNETE